MKEFDTLSNDIFGDINSQFGRALSLMDHEPHGGEALIDIPRLGGGGFPSNHFGGGSNKGSYMKKVSHYSKKLDPSGMPVVEQYESQSKGMIGNNGQKIGERQQRYKNTGTGLQKFSNERNLNNQGRKVIHEKLGSD